MRPVLTFLILGGMALPAVAQDGPTTPKDVLALFPWGADSCYAARFAKTDLKPKQTLSEFYLYRLFDPDPRKEEIDLPRAEAIARDRKPDHEQTTDVLARFSDSPHVYTQSVTCSSFEGDRMPVSCYVDCDGGSFKLSKSRNDAGIAFEDEGGLSMNQSCGEPDEEGADRWMTAKDAGSSFTAVKADPSVCIAAAKSAVPHFAADPVPLRERVDKDGWRCLSRSYDTAHLASHPKQNVTAIAVAIKGPTKIEHNEGEYIEATLETTLSFKLRNGKTVTRDSECRAIGFEFACETFRLRRKDDKSALLAAGDYTDPEQPIVMLDTTLGRDDALFRLDASAAGDCRVH